MIGGRALGSAQNSKWQEYSKNEKRVHVFMEEEGEGGLFDNLVKNVVIYTNGFWW